MFKKLKVFIRNNYQWLICFISLILFLTITEDVFDNEIIKGDTIGYNIVSSLISDKLTPLVKMVTWFGSAACLILLTVILFIIIKNKKAGLLIGTNLVIITILNQTLKSLLQRPRPTEFRIINETGYSFPSGHSMISMAFYGFLIYLIYKNLKNKYLKFTLIIILFILIISIGLSRIYLGVHYTSDVLAGFLLSIAYLIFYCHVVDKVLYVGDEFEK